jgi:predicted ATPase
MTVTAFRVQNFMGFEDSGWIELRPITLLFGRNSSGKSALIRALLLLRQSLDSSPDSGALLFVKDDGYDFGDYREIVRDHDVGQDVLCWFKLQIVASEDTPAIRKLVLDAIYDLVGHPLDTETSIIQVYID